MSFQHRFVQGLGVEKRMHPPHLLGRILLAKQDYRLIR